MKVTIIEPYGFCPGVIRSIDICYKTKAKYPNFQIVILGELVHNDTVLQNLIQDGFLIIKNPTIDKIQNFNSNNAIFIFSAHGHDKKLENFLIENGFIFFDSTCQNIQKTIDSIKNIQNKCVVFVGKKNHAESIAILSQSNKIILYEVTNQTKIIKNDLFDYMAVQSCLSNDEVEHFYTMFSSKNKNLKLLNSTCGQNSIRQNALLNLDKNINKIIICSSKNSENGRALFDIAQKKFENSQSYFVSSKSDLSKIEFNNLDNVAILTATSTPKEFAEYIKNNIDQSVK